MDVLIGQDPGPATNLNLIPVVVPDHFIEDGAELHEVDEGMSLAAGPQIFRGGVYLYEN